MFVHGPRIALGFREALLGRALGPHGGVPMGLRDAQSASEHHAHVVLGTGIAGFRQGRRRYSPGSRIIAVQERRRAGFVGVRRNS
jgi:VIT1/CCC1 family predicted Fe2+/Mn2+ transporter